MSTVQTPPSSGSAQHEGASTAQTTGTRTTGPQPMNAAKSPVGSGSIAVVGILMAIAVIALGVVAVRDALVDAGVVTGTSWLRGAAGAVDGMTAAAWMVPVGAVLILLGAWLLLSALRPRPRTAVSVTSSTGVYLRPKDVSRLVQATAEQVDGVLSADVSSTRHTVTVRVRGTGASVMSDEVRAAVAHRLSALVKPPTVKVVSTGGTP